MSTSSPCPVCGAVLEVHQTADQFGNALWDANAVIAAHIASSHPPL